RADAPAFLREREISGAHLEFHDHRRHVIRNRLVIDEERAAFLVDLDDLSADRMTDRAVVGDRGRGVAFGRVAAVAPCEQERRGEHRGQWKRAPPGGRKRTGGFHLRRIQGRAGRAGRISGHGHTDSSAWVFVKGFAMTRPARLDPGDFVRLMSPIPRSSRTTSYRPGLAWFAAIGGLWVFVLVTLGAFTTSIGAGMVFP